MDEDDAVRHAQWRAWALNELEAAGWTREAQPGVRYLVDQFMGMGVVSTHQGAPDLGTAIDIVSHLLQYTSLSGGGPIAPQVAAADMFDWVLVQPGQALNRQDRVRVRADAYTGPEGVHNGREGTVMAVRYGHAVVHYDGMPPGSGHHHSIRLLERRIPKA